MTDKDIILEYLTLEDLKNNSELYEIAEGSGLDVVKKLLKNHEQLGKLYVPMVQNLTTLMERFISANSKLGLQKLMKITGLSRNRIIKIFKGIERK